MIPLNTQKAEKPVWDADGFLDVHSVFSTIQGEGPNAGRRSIFVRLAGCNLQCPACDTEYTSIRKSMHPKDIISKVWDAGNGGGTSLIVLTGGEPFRQNVRPFIIAACAKGYEVQVETNGTLGPASVPRPEIQLKSLNRLTIVVSPKAPKVNKFFECWYYTKVYPPVASLYWKYVLRAGEANKHDGLPNKALGGMAPSRPPEHMLSNPELRDKYVYVNPEDSGDAAQNKLNAEAAAETCLRFGYRLGAQLHKIAGVP